MSSDTYAIADLVALVLADEHCSYYSEKQPDAKALFTQQLYCSLGLTAHLGWVVQHEIPLCGFSLLSLCFGSISVIDASDTFPADPLGGLCSPICLPQQPN
jgi:hypothetical protein